ncbi:MAG TPA: multidrug transporter [Candidatus Paceibacterota bacterium]
MKKERKVIMYRDSKTGKLVGKKYSKHHPATTERETRPIRKKR